MRATRPTRHASLRSALTLAVCLAALGCGAEQPGDASTDLTSDDRGSPADVARDSADEDAGSFDVDGDTAGFDAHGDPPPEDADPEDTAAADLGDIPALGRWRSLETLPADRRQEHATVALGRELYLIGGFAGSLQATASIEAYDPGLDRWRRGVDAPTAMHHPNAVADPDGGRIWVLGHLGPDANNASGAVYTYDVRDDRWALGAALPEGRERGGSGVVLWEGAAYVLGGLRGDRSVADVDRLDLESGVWTALPDLPVGPLDHLAAGVIDGVIYVGGGRANGANTNVFHAFDIDTETWRELRPMLTARAGAAAAVSGGRLFVFGGEGNPSSPVGIFEETEAYDPVADRWLTLAPMPTPRHGLGAAPLQGRIYLPLGADEEGFSFVSAFEVFVPPPR